MASDILEELAQGDDSKSSNVLEELASDYTPPQQEANKPEKKIPWYARPLPGQKYADAASRQIGLGARAAVEGITSIPMMAMDVGVESRNMINQLRRGQTPKMADFNPFSKEPGTPLDYELPSAMWHRQLTQMGLPEPQTRMEKINSFVGSVLAGSAFPSPQIKNPAPANFIKVALSPKEMILRQGIEEGLSVPPTTAKPNVLNKAAEGFAGKLTTAQQASIKNQPVFNEMAKRALGLGPEDTLTPATLEGIRSTAGKVYEQVANAGDIRPDAQFIDDLASLGRGADEIAKDFPGANVGNSKQIGEMVDSLLQDKFSSKAALQYLRELRKQATANLSHLNSADPAKQALGMAQREAAASLEDLIGRHLEQVGQPELAGALSQARKTIAMTHTVENALNESTGNVVAGKLAKQLASGKPLSGDLRSIAKFAQTFPKASREILESMPGVSPLDYAAALGGAVIAKSPSPLAAITLRPAVRSAILSPWWQQSLIDKPFRVPENIGVVPSAIVQSGAGVSTQ